MLFSLKNIETPPNNVVTEEIGYEYENESRDRQVLK